MGIREEREEEYGMREERDEENRDKGGMKGRKWG